MIEKVLAIYNPTPTHKEERPIISDKTIDPGTRRKLVIAHKAVPGDVIEVPVKDVIAHLDRYLAYPCGEQFDVEGGVRVVNPCDSQPIEEPEVLFYEEEILEDVPLLEDTEAALLEMLELESRVKKVMDAGVTSVEQFMSMTDEDVIDLFGKIYVTLREKNG